MANAGTTNDVLRKISEALEADVVIYSGEISIQGLEKVLKATLKPTNKNIFFALCTPGGCAHSAFKITRRLQEKYEKFHLYVHGYCKSAGTLIAIGSDEIIMSDCAEFGPLDVQLKDKDEIASFSSGLNIDEAMLALKERTSAFFTDMLIELTTAAGLTTKMAAELASDLAARFYSPIVSQIEPMRIGETERAVKIALAYGERLTSDNRGNISVKSLVRLVNGYPDHGFVIDYKEAERIFRTVRRENSFETEFGMGQAELLKYPKRDAMLIKKIYPQEAVDEPTSKQRGAERVAKSAQRTRKANEGNSGQIIQYEPTKKSTRQPRARKKDSATG